MHLFHVTEDIQMEPSLRLMLMIDGDNAEAALLPQILAEISKYGVPKIRRVYGDWRSPQLKSWHDLLAVYALKPVQQSAYTAHKNATDIALIIDAMDFLYTAEVDGICIVSSDSDYTPLATRIREKGLFVIGIGRMQTPRAFVNSCDRFIYTENLQSELGEPETDIPAPDDPVADVNTVDADNVSASVPIEALFQTAYDATSQDDEGWAHLGGIGHSLRQLDPGFDPRTYGHKSLSHLVQAKPDLYETQKRESTGGNIAFYVRLLPS